MPESKQLWRVLNEPITIWILSTVVVGIFGTVYTELQSRLVAEREQERRIDRLNMQAGVRLEYAAKLAKTATDPLIVLETLLMDTAETRVDQDFTGRPTLALMLELEQVRGLCGTGADQRQRFGALMQESMLIRSRLMHEPGQSSDQAINSRVRAIIEELLRL